MTSPRARSQAFSITIEQRGTSWQAKLSGVGALGAWHPTAAAAIDEVSRYLDELVEPATKKTPRPRKRALEGGFKRALNRALRTPLRRRVRAEAGEQSGYRKKLKAKAR